MKLYYSPGACSLASHVALIEAGIAHDLEKVDLKAKTTAHGDDFRAINPKGYVPALALDEGGLLTENVAVLTYIGDQSDTLRPAEGLPRYRVLEATAFVSTELHKNFKPFFSPDADEAARAKARDMLSQRFATAADLMGDRDWLVGDRMSVADCYLFVMLMWATNKVGMDVPDPLRRFLDRMMARPSVGQALREEGLGG